MVTVTPNIQGYDYIKLLLAIAFKGPRVNCPLSKGNHAPNQGLLKDRQESFSKIYKLFL